MTNVETLAPLPNLAIRFAFRDLRPPRKGEVTGGASP
jgi:hypothetical protein